MDSWWLSRELSHFGYFPDDDPPRVQDVQAAQDIIRDFNR
jgi:hypothetical protein